MTREKCGQLGWLYDIRIKRNIQKIVEEDGVQVTKTLIIRCI